MHGFPIQQAKVQPPPLRPATVRRDRLLSWLDERVSRRLLFVTAEAGYGKTTLLADWARRAPIRVAWCRIEPDDANWASVLRYLVAAGREIDSEFAPLTSVLLDELAAGANNREIVRATFLQELDALAMARRVAFVLDDAHLLRGTRDVTALLSEIVNRGPERLTWIFAGRRRPGIAVTRLRAIGEMQELRRTDLRFQLDETIEMFRAGVERPVAQDLIETVVQRTEGWAASLQLVEAAIRDRSDAERRTFIRSLSGARGDLYDYLAEEVVGELEPEAQAFLMRTSVMRVVTVEDIELVTGMSGAESEAIVAEIVPLGLLDVAGPEEPDAYRYHPLVREFLESRLRQEQGHDVVVALHRRLAASHEGRDWRTAAYHYDAIKATDDLQRVLVESAPTIMARGEFDVASHYADALGHADTDPAREMFASRVALDRGAPAEALRHAQTAYDATRSAKAGIRGLATANLLTMNFAVGDRGAAHDLAEQLIRSDAPEGLIAIAKASKAALDACDTGRLDEYQSVLEQMEQEQRASRSTHYLGVTLLNLAVVAQARGRANEALDRSRVAAELLTSGSRRGERVAARMCMGWALAHIGQWPQAEFELAEGLNHAEGSVRNEALIESAYCWIRYGALDEAMRLTSLATHDPNPSVLATSLLPLAQAELMLRLARPEEARRILDRIDRRVGSMALAFESRRQYVEAKTAYALRSPGFEQAISEALSVSREQGSDYYSEVLVVLQAIASSNDDLANCLTDTLSRDPAYINLIAEELAPRLADISPRIFERLAMEVEARSDRWRNALRSVLTGPNPSSRAAVLLDRIGSREDVALIRSFARSSRGRSSNRRLGLDLARRVAPRVFVEDMGRVRIKMAGQYLEGLEARRKVLELICYLLTRPDMSATRDEVVDAVWPETEPSSALNSLNQTLYFLRRVLEPTYNENLSPNYVHHESDVVWLDSTLITSRSLKCRQLLKKASFEQQDREAVALATEYTAKFALDFSYEDWASSFRDTLHAAYLQMMETAISLRLRDRRSVEAIALARRVLEIDINAEQVERMLIRAYDQLGARAAVREQYAHYAQLMRDELGVEPPPLAELIVPGLEST